MKTWTEGTPARCNRCEGKFDLPKDIEGYDFYGKEKAARLQDFCRCPHCEMTDCHWIYKIDIEEA